MIAEREGAHLAVGVYALRKRRPSLATRSKFGVLTQEHP
jgi:hypothetical protein